ncbi:hypothetical protein UR09_02035 [Candidatus Nitromaritima sp. SCGC AAA799-A02]|nr:hypothetical protein UZ36_04560 [Candidatus Nitromaritima sp. SCGC AAA799-C22]KMP11981.1 hypothetical protein UR09_02035 [Candidatus Nitromaritima sp. SCGC AAA799-A02]
MNRHFAPFFRVGVIFLLLVWLIPVSGYAGTINQIRLSDGSLIQAEIVSYSNGIYTLRSDALGTFSLDESRVRSIQPKESQAASPSSGTVDAQVKQQMQKLQQEMMSDPKTMKLLSDLQNDPSIKNILEDKELMRAIEKGDMNRLGQDPKIQSLMNSDEVDKIIKRHQPK